MNNSALKLAIIPLLMFGFGFALVPLYDVFCDITGLNGKTGRVEASEIDADMVDRSRTIEVRFLANTNTGLPWSFEPLVKKMEVHPGHLRARLPAFVCDPELMPSTGSVFRERSRDWYTNGIEDAHNDRRGRESNVRIDRRVVFHNGLGVSVGHAKSRAPWEETRLQRSFLVRAPEFLPAVVVVLDKRVSQWFTE